MHKINVFQIFFGFYLSTTTIGKEDLEELIDQLVKKSDILFKLLLFGELQDL